MGGGGFIIKKIWWNSPNVARVKEIYAGAMKIIKSGGWVGERIKYYQYEISNGIE